MDEVSLAADTLIFHLQDGRISRHRFRPESVGMKKSTARALTGGTPDENVALARAILAGKKGPKRDAVVLNAAFGLMAAGRVRRVQEGIRSAEESLDSGSAREKLDQLVQMTQRP